MVISFSTQRAKVIKAYIALTTFKIFMVKLKEWGQLFRMQTAPATLLVILIPYLTNAGLFDVKTLILSLFIILIHYLSCGHNSLMDTAMGYDLKDPHKTHHPLVTGAIKLNQAHNLVHWSLPVLTVACALLTFYWAANAGLALICIATWISFGHSYNDGLSKEGLGFVANALWLSIAGAWGWFLSHRDLNPVAIVYLCYVFCVAVYQISWSGFIKEMEMKERSNVLTKMGARLEKIRWGPKMFNPGKAWVYAYFIKAITLIFGMYLCWLNFNLVRLVMLVILGTGMSYYLAKTTKKRKYIRGEELLNMSLMEIFTIYLPIPLMLGLFESVFLMATGILYFFTINLILWGKPYPRV